MARLATGLLLSAFLAGCPSFPDLDQRRLKGEAYCGDGEVGKTEVCDDGNDQPGDGCTARCVAEAGWACSAGCKEKLGDGLVVGEEECDDSNTSPGDGCSPVDIIEAGWECTKDPCTELSETCGDSIKVGQEACDLGGAVNSNAPNAECRKDCTFARCGDGIVDGDRPEACDDGEENALAPDACRPTCARPTCGDGIKDPDRGESCDDEGEEPGDGCGAGCAIEDGWSCDPGCLEVHGDLKVVGTEECDDGNADPGDGCDASGVIETGWRCEPPAPAPCTVLIEICGDGTQVGAEACDEGEGGNSDAPNATCRTNCTLARCGDGVLDDQRPELCDGGAKNSDGPDEACRLDCTLRRCGDGVIDPLAAEECDAGAANTDQPGDGCRPVICLPGNVWRTMEAKSAPSPRREHSAVWTGKEMVVWGGSIDGKPLASGGRYDPGTDRWTATSEKGQPRNQTCGAWTGSEVVYFGGTDDLNAYYIEFYDPASDGWRSFKSGPKGRQGHAFAWSARLRALVIFGGHYPRAPDDIYGDAFTIPTSGLFREIVPDGEPPKPKAYPGFALDEKGSRFFVWDGATSDRLGANGDGAFYDTSKSTWVQMTNKGAPLPRINPLVVWTGKELLVWGGLAEGGRLTLGDGGRYQPPPEEGWTPMSDKGAPSARVDPFYAWTGKLLLVWGGSSAGKYLSDGAAYDPVQDAWFPISDKGAPTPRDAPRLGGVWTGSEFIVWGSGDSKEPTATGARYRP